jgi:hypothetical protein
MCQDGNCTMRSMFSFAKSAGKSGLWLPGRSTVCFTCLLLFVIASFFGSDRNIKVGRSNNDSKSKPCCAALRCLDPDGALMDSRRTLQGVCHEPAADLSNSASMWQLASSCHDAICQPSHPRMFRILCPVLVAKLGPGMRPVPRAHYFAATSPGIGRHCKSDGSTRAADEFGPGCCYCSPHCCSDSSTSCDRNGLA